VRRVEIASRVKLLALEESVHGLQPLEALRRLFDEACAAWPGIAVSFDRFCARLSDGGASLSQTDATVANERARDLYLACACEAGHTAALAAFELYYLDVVAVAIARIDSSTDFADEVRQILRERLLVGPEAKIREYRGGGALRGWVRTTAVRTALNLRRAHRHPTPLAQSTERVAQAIDPELALLQQRHREDVHAAIKRALTELDDGERQLLRFYYVDKLTMSQIAMLYKVGVSTVFRRLEAATDGTLKRVRQDLEQRLALSPAGLDSLLRLVNETLDLSLSRVLLPVVAQ
jgi:RNA polymerase sigma-70 factor (ECF subfamily)